MAAKQVATVQLPQRHMVGRAFTQGAADANGSFYSAWQDMEDSGDLKTLDALNPSPNKNHSDLIIFSPYSIEYWIGSFLPADAETPQGMHTFDLPDSKAASVTEDAEHMLTQLPLQTSFNRIVSMFETAKIKVPEHLGRTVNPYFVESYSVTDDQVKQVEYDLYLSKATGLNDYE
ncbi:hypothetical protein IV38_GL001403 [Lactobacillus selangorensis]|uniref:GyrI-like small molecule binding domain-containing protein n=1 Tax=Lactobacillus selangorensis TaxID=81857 RepID=A0A0R2FIH1_9LACO|nr:hypothetical protein [Lactobacillus selangorensis]KRN28403.1 hypothetical protein IV38_GL001403 [Lactobacillus selangorensis]KRN31904.1 hypothetical protein IV40_GL001190 [Lactobacillus selangorensis]